MFRHRDDSKIFLKKVGAFVDKLKENTYEQKQIELFLRQKQTLDIFLEHKAITKQQYNKSLGDLRDKMGMHGVE